MPRTLDPVAHSLRRDAFVEAATRLIQSRGYEQVAVQDVLDELETSRGAFYHYFDSKDALLEAVVERMADGYDSVLRPVVDDPGLDAVAKMERLVVTGAAWKAERVDLMVATIELWNSDANAALRDKLRSVSAARLAPLLAAVMRQGVREGSFDVVDPDATARVFTDLALGVQAGAIELFLARRAGTISYGQAAAYMAAAVRAFERILGLGSGSLRLVDDATLRLWFDRAATAAGEE